MLRLLQAALMTMSFGQALYNFKWNTSTVEIPVNTHIYNLDKHVYLKSCSTNGESINVNEISVYETHDLYKLSDINFSELGGYYVRLYAKHRDINDCFTYHDVLVKVVDNEKPNVSTSSQLTFDLNSSKPNINDFLLTNFTPSDNYATTRYIKNPNEKPSKLIYEEITNYDLVNFKKVGKYPIKYVVKDGSHNTVEKEFVVNIVDKTPPVVTKKNDSPIILKVGETLDINKYYKITDDSQIKVIFFNPTQFSTPNTYNIVVTVEDEYRNRQVFTVPVEVIAERPKINVVSNELSVGINDTYERVIRLVRSLISSIDNNGTNFAAKDVDIKLEISDELFQRYSGVFNAILSLPNSDKVIVKVSKIDQYAPVISLKPNLSFPLKHNLSKKDNEFNYRDWFTFTDDASPLIDIVVEFKVFGNLGKRGVYDFQIIATDRHRNKSFVTNKIIVDDFEKPVISSKIVSGETVEKVLTEDDYLNPLSYFNFLDNYSDQKELIIWTEPTSFTRPSPREKVEVFVKDASGNVTSETFYFKVIKRNPNIILKNDTMVLNVNDKNFQDTLLDNILDISDNKYNYKFSDIVINHDINISKLNNNPQVVTYTIKDKEGNTLDEKTITVIIKDTQAPVVMLPHNFHLAIEVNSIKVFSPLQYFTVSDNYSDISNIQLKVLNEKSYRLNFIGNYHLTLRATDEAGNSANYSFVLEITDTTPPEIETKTDTYNFRVYSDIKLMDEFKASDNYDKKVLRSIDITGVNNKKPGQYTAWLIATDKSNNTNRKSVTINIVDDISPVIMLRSKKINFEIGQSDYDFAKNVILVKDNYATELENKVSYYHNIDFTTPGIYDIIYEVSDGYNTSYELCTIFVEYPQVPSLELSKNNWQLAGGLTREKILGQIKEKNNRNINVDLLSDISEITTSGSYSLKFLVTDELGKNYEQIVSITVENNGKRKTVIAFMVIVPVIILATTLTAFFLLKKKAKPVNNHVDFSSLDPEN